VIAVGELERGPLNAITDVAGVRVGHTTLIEGDDVRTGVTVVLPTPDGSPCFAAPHRLNGNGELTGLEWVRESGLLTTPIGITNTFSVGVVRDALVTSQHRANRGRWHLPVVGETYDGTLNNIEGMHVKAEHVFAALESAADGAVEEGCVGGGTGMICQGFKGGIGTASRRTGDHVVGVLVQANHGARRRLAIDGVPVGRELGHERVPLPADGPAGSIIVVVATDAPLLPHQLKRIATRVSIGVGRQGGFGGNSSGDIFVAFSTANARAWFNDRPVTDVKMLPNDRITPLFQATAQATEAAITNALLAAETTTGANDLRIYAMPVDRMLAAMKKYGRVP
jgi:D-aminopeptidase